MIIKIFKTDKDNKISFTPEELEALLTDVEQKAYAEGRTAGKNEQALADATSSHTSSSSTLPPWQLGGVINTVNSNGTPKQTLTESTQLDKAFFQS